MGNATRIYKNVEIVTLTGDITKQKVEAIVNPANSWLVMGGGVAGAIKRVGGEEIEKEALKHAPVPVGRAVATGAGKLEAKYVIHAPTMERPAMQVGPENVRLAVRGALECADSLKLESIALPGMGTGVGGLALEQAAQVMLRETKSHIDKGTSLRKILFVGLRDDMTHAFSMAVKGVFG
ncbi:MAG: macro domain-containing protein [Candidatus Bathyarchaeia archaeon]